MLSLGFSTAIGTQGFSWREQKAVEGFEWIELALGYCRDNSVATWEKNMKQLQADYDTARKLGLKVWSIHLPYGGDMDLTEDVTNSEIVLWNLKRYVDATMYMKPHCYVTHAHGRTENFPQEERNRFVENAHRNVAELSKYIAEKGAVLAVEGLPRTCIGNTAKECEHIIKDTKARICFDVNHMMHDTHENFVKVLGGSIETLHLSDYDLGDEKHWVPGDGKVNWKEIISLLSSVQYTGPLMFEVKFRKDGVTPTLQDVKNGFYKAIK